LAERIGGFHGIGVAKPTRMELSNDSTASPPSWAERFALLLDEHRDRAENFIASRQQRFQQAGTVLEEQFHRMEAEIRAAHEGLARLQEERDALAVRVTQAESSAGDPSAEKNLQRRLEMALEDLREVNEKNSQLQEQLTKARSSAAKLGQQSHEPGWLDWETEKKRILAALEADAVGENAVQKGERLGIEEVLRMNDEVIAMKDREIAELKHGLEQRGCNSAAAEELVIRQAINTDAAIQEERGRLQQLQKEWREKLRQAEIELSLERAKIARERAELDEQFHSAKEARPKSTDTGGTQEQTERTSCGRWLAQLGLTAADREPSRR
jgi:hypothetical protein